MSTYINPPRRTRLTTGADIDAAIAADLRDRRERAGVTLSTLADVFGEQKAALHKHESRINSISAAKYLGVIHFLRDSCPDHPAMPLINALGFRNIEALNHPERSSARLAGMLDLMDMTRKVCPTHPALPLADFLLYKRG
jgi:hypothetical protein